MCDNARLPRFLKAVSGLVPATLLFFLFVVSTAGICGSVAGSANTQSGLADAKPVPDVPVKPEDADAPDEVANTADAKPGQADSDPGHGDGLAGGELEQKSYPNVRNECLRLGGNGKPSVVLYYPAFGKAAVDADIATFVMGLANAFLEGSDKDGVGADDERGNVEDGNSGPAGSEMSGMFELHRPGADTASLTFSLYSYTGGAHGNLEIVCLNYDLASAKRLSFADIFSRPQKAIEIMSSLSRARLAEQLGNDKDEDMLQSGTAPNEENFSSLTLTSTGVRVEFAPYQVAPWFAGPQRVDFILSELAAARPSPKIWPGADKLPEPAEKPDNSGSERKSDPATDEE